MVGGEAVVVAGGEERRFHGGEGELALHRVHNLVGGVGGGGGGGSARGGHPPAGDGGSEGLGGMEREI